MQTFHHAQAHALLRDLHTPSKLIYWTDLGFSIALGWMGFAVAVAAPIDSWVFFAAMALAVVMLYRGACFLHEISHIRNRVLPGFETVWNLFIGVPLLMPTFTYIGVHTDHHRISSYGTANDPEYLPFSTSPVMTTVFLLQSVLFPVALVVRFLVLTPIAFFVPRLQLWLAVHASSFAMNPRYSRPILPGTLSKIRTWSAVIFAFWAAVITLICTEVIDYEYVLVWFAVVAVISFVNTLRALGAHRYESDGEPMDRTAQLLDSIDTPGGVCTELWAPVGLRYHALHHYFPGIPYHNLHEAYRRLMGNSPVKEGYVDVVSPALRVSLRTLLETGKRTVAARRGTVEAHAGDQP